ncbi:MAG: bifunctional DNA-formamidopyrimidine glycosylase/DNA-(apurinic or apyrimidinic site) lyase [Acidobacteriaceae bacterium]
MRWVTGRYGSGEDGFGRAQKLRPTPDFILPGITLGLGVDVPELPEVETVANGVDARVRGQQIASVWTSGKPQTFKSAESEIDEVLTGARIERVRRVGKTIVMTLRRGWAAEGRGGAEFLVHLGMTGRLLVSAGEVPLPPHTHAVLRLTDGREVRFVDPRRFGRLSVRVLETEETGYAGPGVEPLTIGEEEFRELFRGRKTAIKAALLNQSLLHGVGNIYADEALARAGVRPRRQAGRLTRAESVRLLAALKEVLTRAIELGGSSVSDYVDADGVRGFFQLEHRVYGRGGEPCRICGTAIRKIVVGGRGTHFCPKCQR